MADRYEELAATIDNIVTSVFVTPVGPEFLGSVLQAAFEKANVALDYRGEFEPNEVVITEAFEVMPHEEIAAMVASLGTETIENSSRNWNDLSAAATTGSDAFRSGIETAMTSGWSGPTADAVRGGVADYVSSATALSTSMSLISNKLLEAHSGFTQTQSRMPPVVAVPVSSMIDSLLPIPFAAKDAASAREEQQEEARRIMRSVYVPGVLQSDSQVPVLPAAHDPVTDGAGSSGGGGLGNPVGFGGNGIGGSSPGGSGTEGSGDSAAQTQAGYPKAAEAGTSGTAPDQPGSDRSGAQYPADNSGETRAASAGPGSAGGSAGSGVGSGSGGLYGAAVPGSNGGAGPTGSAYGGGAGSGGGSGAGPSYGGSILGSPIGSGSGSTAAGSGPGGAAAASVGRPGAHGLPGMGAMGAAGARGTGDNDGEHATPGYLVDVSNGSELIGDLPLVAPPVLGG